MVIAVVIIILLFLVQQFGTGVVGGIFSPVILIWLFFNTAIGLYNIIVYRPDIFKAFGPNYWFAFFLRNGRGGWEKLGGVVLCVTGGAPSPDARCVCLDTCASSVRSIWGGRTRPEALCSKCSGLAPACVLRGLVLLMSSSVFLA